MRHNGESPGASREHAVTVPNASDPVQTIGYERSADEKLPTSPAATLLVPSGQAYPGTDSPAPSPGPQRGGSVGGARVAEYEILAELGQGGMGIVYKARHLGLNRTVALKMIHANLGGKDVLTRFRAEAEAVARLQHPNIVQIYDVGEHNGRPYLALEFVDGGTLADRIENKPQPPRWAALMVETLARAVHHAHQAGVVHRDLKPGNVLLTKDEQPKITDFGLAKDMARISSHTRAGSILGTPSYMAPEQAGGVIADIGPHTDVYALGAILYEMLTGRPPFRGESPIDTIRQVLDSEVVPPSRLQPKVPRDLETICLKCLFKPFKRRYPSSLELADDLKRFLEGDPIRARPIGAVERAVKWVRRRPTLSALLASALLAASLAVAGGVWAYLAVTRRAHEAEQARHTADEARAEGTRRMVRLNVANGARLLQDRDTLASRLWFAEALRLEEGGVERQQMHRIRLRIAADHSPRLTQVWVHEAALNDARLSSDGRLVLVGGEDGVARIWDTVTGQAVCPPLDHGNPIKCVALTADGRTAATGGTQGNLRLWEVATGRHQQVLPVGGRVLFAEFSPNGKWLLTGNATGQAHLWDVAAAKLRLTTALPTRLEAIAWSADSRTFLAASRDGSVQVTDVLSGKLVGPALRHGGAIEYAALSPDGRRVATAGMDGVVRVWDAVTGAALLDRPPRHARVVNQVQFSPDGGRLVTGSLDGTAQVWNAVGGQQIGLAARHTSAVQRVVFSPDGRWYATAGDDNTARVWDAATGEPLTPPLRDNATPTALAFSPNGHQLLVCSSSRLTRLWDLIVPRPTPSDPPDTEDADDLDEMQTVFSPDRTRLLSFGGGQAVRVRRAANHEPLTPPLRSDGPVTAAAFSPDGTRIVTGDAEGGIQMWETDTGRPLLAKPPHHSSRVHQVVFSPDGAWVASASDDDTAGIWSTTTGEARTPPVRLSGSVVAVAFGMDGRCLYTQVMDDSGAVWDVATGEPLTPPLSAAEAKHWSDYLVADERPMEVLLGLGRVLTGLRLDDTGSLVPFEPGMLRTEWQRLRQQYPASFVTSPDEIAAWRRRQVEECEGAGQWFAAVWHLGKLIEAEPAQVDYRRRRAAAWARLGQWADAAADCSEAILLRPGDPDLWYQRGLAQGKLGHWNRAAIDFGKALELRTDPRGSANTLARVRLEAGNLAGYRQACQELLATCTDADPDRTRLAVWTCCLAPDGADPATLVKLSEHCGSGPTALLTQGAALVRAGRFEEGAARLTAALAQQPELPTAWLFLALARKGLGQPEQARTWLDKANTWAHPRLTATETDSPPLSWDARLEVTVLLAEVKKNL